MRPQEVRPTRRHDLTHLADVLLGSLDLLCEAVAVDYRQSPCFRNRLLGRLLSDLLVQWSIQPTEGVEERESGGRQVHDVVVR